MSKTAKILIIVIFVVGIGFLFFSLKTVEQIKTQKEIILSLQESIANLENTITSLEEIIDLAKERIGSLRAERQRLTKELRETKIAKERVERELAQVKREKEQIEGELANAKVKITTLEEQNQTYQDQIAELTSAKSQLEQQLSASRVKYGQMTKKITKQEEEEEKPIPLKEGLEVVEGIEGEIVEISPTGVAAINFEGAINPKKGDTYYAVRSGKVVGKLIVRDIYHNILISQMRLEEVDDKIKEGDKVKLVR